MTTMSVRSLNKVMLIGNLTRDPNLRFTPSNTAVCSFGIATNRSWVTDDGQKEERTDFHNIVAWGKLAEICDEILQKGDKVYVEGRMQTRDWKVDDGPDRRVTEVVVDNMIKLRSPYGGNDDEETQEEPAGLAEESGSTDSEDVADDIPF
ncbi:MAG: single-stranded DNA-binding protein [Candidatus Pacebacteria bacterium]|nr:single-stranded DNA-binding protein [Candidatus Paceibacterota bacterium]